MRIRFADEELRRICEQRTGATRKLGAPSARKLAARLADIEAASCVTDLAAGSPHALSRDRQGQYAVSLAGGHRLVFVPADDPAPRLPAGQIDWRRVTAVCIVFIGDYHD